MSFRLGAGILAAASAAVSLSVLRQSRNLDTPRCKPAAKQHKRVVIIGGGVMGASTAWNLTHRTHKGDVQVTLIDANHPIRGSWHESRIARSAYEDTMYVKMVLRAFEHWRRLEQEAGKGQLIFMTGILDIGAKDKLPHLVQAYRELGMPVELFSGATAESRQKFERRFPTIRLGPTQEAVYQKDTAMLMADVCVQSMLEIAEKRGAVLHLDDAVVKIDRASRTVTTQKGVVCEYDQLVVASGPWTNACLNLAGLGLIPMVVSNEQAVYLQLRKGVDESAMEPDKSPVVVEHDTNIYAVPHLPGGVAGCKIGAHAAGDFMDNDEFILPAGAVAMLKQLEQPSKDIHAEQSDEIHLPMLKVVQDSAKLTFPLLDHTSGADTYTRCLYQNLMRNSRATGRMSEYSSDFAAGPHPEDRNVLVTAGFTGEGFKFGPVIGELLTDYLLGEQQEKVPDMRKRFALDNGSLDIFPSNNSK